MIKNFRIFETSDGRFVNNIIELNVLTLLEALVVIIESQKLYLDEIVIKPGYLILKSGTYEIKLREIL